MAPQRSTGGCKYTYSLASSIKVACLKSHEQSCLSWKEKKKEDREFSWAAVKSILKEGKSKHHHDKRCAHEAAQDTTLVVQEAGSATDSLAAADSHYHYDDAGLEGLNDVQSVRGDSWLYFKFAKLVHQAALSKDQTNELLKFIWRVADGHIKFTLKTHNDVSAA
ncbi:uncharacterized protein BJ212DRAFT_1297315 [Suillus subaureus]|uniref:Uncharacterized protein n=1 Tax=Suillus subaureus TaxID=48587 RepID=A0A9P7EIB8_9AGAM|nr:uncharacterized protein BJ212DRAFT_1297315 [Suillus subaureus]KAG1822076.1 hypothetical protein BJ212DRAFT_1297315 [Suillus subaureus]